MVDKEYTDGTKDWKYKNSKIEFYNENKELVGEIEFENPIDAYYQFTKEYYLVVEAKDVNINVIYLCDRENNVIWEGNGRSCAVKLIDNNVIVRIDNITNEYFYSMSVDGKWEEVTGYYHDETGIHKGIEDGGLQYTLGENEDIYLKRSNDTWKLVYSDGSPVYEDRYFEMSEYSNRYFFLVNENSDVCLIDDKGEIIVDYGTFTYEQGNSCPDFMGGNLWYDEVFAGDDALYIVRENGDLYDIYRYGAQ